MDNKMTENQTIDINANKILIAILNTITEVNVPALTLLDSGQTDRELQIDYDSDNQWFTIKLRDKDEQ
jgi:hypothetical protein